MASNISQKSPASQKSERRILALVLPQLLCELSAERRLRLDAPQQPPRAVILVQQTASNVKASQPLTAVCPRAYRHGVRAGQTASEACAQLAGLKIELVSLEQVEEKLAMVAEIASRYGTSFCWQLPDTVWLDVSGVGHLFSGETQLAREVQEQISWMGHLTRTVIAPGPLLAQAVGRSIAQSVSIVSDDAAQQAMQNLPLTVLPLEPEKISWFARLGIYRAGQLAELPAKTTAGRLGPRAAQILDLIRGIDRTPLTPQSLAQAIHQKVEWEEPSEGLSPLLFALRGLVAKLSARLTSRGEAIRFLQCEIRHDPAVADFRKVARTTTLEFEFASPLQKEGDLERVLKSRLERTELPAPSIGVELTGSELSPHLMNQVTFGQKKSASLCGEASQHQQFAVLLAELQSDVGAHHLGVLRIPDSHRPEDRSVLQAISLSPQRSSQRRKSRQSSCPDFDRITRLLPSPHALMAPTSPFPLCVGLTFGLGNELYTVERLRFLQRLDAVGWWTERATNRDYYWGQLKGLRGRTEALLFVERQTNMAYLQGFCD